MEYYGSLNIYSQVNIDIELVQMDRYKVVDRFDTITDRFIKGSYLELIFTNWKKAWLLGDVYVL